MISAILPVSSPAAAFLHLGKSLESGLDSWSQIITLVTLVGLLWGCCLLNMIISLLLVHSSQINLNLKTRGNFINTADVKICGKKNSSWASMAL